MEPLSATQHFLGKEKSCSALYIANGRTPIFRTYLRVILRILREEKIPPNNFWWWHTIGLTKPNSPKTALPSAFQACMHTPYKHSRHKHLITFYTWGLDLIGPTHPPLNGYIRVFVALSNSLSGWKQFHSKKSNGSGHSQLHQGAYHLSLWHLAQDHKRQQYISLIPIFGGKPYKTLGSRRTIILPKNCETLTCKGEMPSIRKEKPMLSPNGKPCEVARKPTNYSYGKTPTCEG